MKPLALRFPSPPTSGQLADLLRDWLQHTRYAPDLQDVRVPPDREEAVATLIEGERTWEVRLHRAGPPDTWLLHASTRVAPEEPNRSWSLLAGAVMAVLGIVLAMRWLSFGVVPFLIGVVAALWIGALVAGMTWSRAWDRRATAATREGGGQGPAEELLQHLTDVIGRDDRARLA